MALRNTMSILYYLRKEKAKKPKEVPIYMRITVNGKRAEMSTQRKINPKKWNTKAGYARGTSDEIRNLNDYLHLLRQRVYDAQKELLEEHEVVTSIALRNIVQGKSKCQYTLMETFEYHNQQLKEKVPEFYSELTWKRFETTKQHCKAYLMHKYKREDIYLTQLNYAFVSGLEHYFKTVKKCNHNTSTKYIKSLKKVTNLAIKNEWIRRDPFAAFSVKLKAVNRDFLTKDELTSIEEIETSIARLELVRDIFVFSCYTGLAYSDVERLTRDSIRKGIDGDLWLFIQRKKTSTESKVPLLPKARSILNKYNNHPDLINSDRILPIFSNQKMNAYLKEVAALAKINKLLTFHIARHTFATTVTLTNGVPIESVSSMLGHKDLRTTQIYAKVVEEKVSEDMERLKTKLELDEKKSKKEQKKNPA